MFTRALVLVTLMVGMLLCSVALATDQPPDAQIDQCSENLKLIGKAIAEFQAQNHRLPDHLSDLYPKYISDKKVFHCPADPTPGGTGRSYFRGDPKMPCSYLYEFSGDISNGLPTKMGPFPPPDVGDAWGTDRNVRMRLRYFFGDRVPIVRCFHHKDEYSDQPRVLNLTLDGQIYRSQTVWEDEPDTATVLLDNATRDLKAGAAAFEKNWYLGPLEQYGWGKLDQPEYQQLRPKFAVFADALVAAAPNLPPENQWYAWRVAAGYYDAAGASDKALQALRQSVRLAAARDVFEPSRVDRADFNDLMFMTKLMADIQRHAGHSEDDLLLTLLLHRTEPQNGYYARRASEVAKALSGTATADAWADVAEPTRTRTGKPAPDFDLPTPDGSHVSLSQLRGSHKAVLVNFFFYGCGPCRAESPQLSKVYDQYKTRGLAAVAIDRGDTPQSVAKFVHDYHLTLPVALGGDGRDDHTDVFSKYGVGTYPTNILIDGSGKVIWVHIGFGDDSVADLQQQLEKLISR